jgi:hypothetical protein
MAEERYEYQADTGSVSVTTSFSDDPNHRIAYLEARVGELHELIGKLRGEREAERSSRQAWAEEADEWTQNAQEWYEASDKLLHAYNSLVLELGNEWPKERRAKFLAFVEARHPYLARPLKLDSLPSDFDDMRAFPRRFCACPTAEQLSKLGPGFSRPQCAVHTQSGEDA